MINFMTVENQNLVMALHNAVHSSTLQIYPKDHNLITEGYLTPIPPKNDAAAYFLHENQTFVQLSPKGRELLWKALM